MVEALRTYDNGQTYTDLCLATSMFDKACEGRHKIWNDLEIREACSIAYNMIKERTETRHHVLEYAAQYANVTPIDTFRLIPRIDQIRILCLGLDLDTSEYAKRRARFEVLRVITDKENMQIGVRLYHLRRYLMGSSICVRHLDHTAYYGSDETIWYDKGLWDVLRLTEQGQITTSRALRSAIKKQLKIIGPELGFK
jgi:hypothetical protein